MAQRKKPQPANNLKPFYYILGLVAVVGLGAIAWTMLKSKQAASELVQLPPEATSDANQLVQAARGVKTGPDNAPVKLIVFSDYMCPACGIFATTVEPFLRDEYLNTGKAQLVYYDYPLEGHRWSFLAARAARCAEDQDKFREYHDKLFATQQEWATATSQPTGRFEDYARDVGVEKGAFKSCLNGDKHADLVTANHALGDRLGVNSTPSLYMNGRMLRTEWGSYSDLKKAIEAELGSTGTSGAAQ